MSRDESNNAYLTLSNLTTEHLKAIVIDAKRNALRRCGIKTSSAHVEVKLKIADINAALRAKGFDEYYPSQLPPSITVPPSEGGGGSNQINLEEFVKLNYERDGVPREEEWKMIMEWLAVDGVKTENTGVGGGRKRKNGEDGSLPPPPTHHVRVTNPQIPSLISACTNPSETSQAEFLRLTKSILKSLPQSVLYPALVPSITALLKPTSKASKLARPLALLHSLLLTSPSSALNPPALPPPFLGHLHALLPKLLTLAISPTYELSKQTREKALNLIRTLCTLCEETAPDLGARIIREGMRVIKSRMDAVVGEGEGTAEEIGVDSMAPIGGDPSLDAALKLTLQPGLGFEDTPSIYRTFLVPILPTLSRKFPHLKDLLLPYTTRYVKEQGDGDIYEEWIGEEVGINGGGGGDVFV